MSNRQKSPSRKRSGRKGIRQIGILVLLVTGLLRVDTSQWPAPPPPVWALYATHVGKTERFTLQDGSRVDLNTGSEIKVRFTGREREIVLLHGEALFTVAHNPDWPFAVKAGVATIRAIGTKFSVRLREDDAADVMVIEGTIAIDGGRKRWAPGHVGYLQAGSPFSLAAYTGDLISLNSKTVLSRMRLSPATLKRRTAWTDGWLWFSKDPLPEAVAQFNRYHDQRLVLVDPALASLEIGGRFRSSDLESFIATLEHSFNVRTMSSGFHETGPDTIYLVGRCERARQQCNWPLVQ
jgi:transmembrane sensor